MGLLSTLQLQPPASWAHGGPPGGGAQAGRSGPPGALGQAAGGAKKAAPAKSDGKAVATQQVLGHLRWGTHQGVLYALADGDGDEVEKGRGAQWRDMALANAGCRGLVAAHANLGAVEKKWRAQSDATYGAALLKRVSDAMAAVSKRKADDPAFRAALQQYYKKFDEVKRLALDIEVKDSDFNARLSHLGSVLKTGEIEKAAAYVKMTEDEIAQVRADIEAAKGILGKVLSLGSSIQGFAAAPTAAGAIGLISQGVTELGGVIIEGQYAAQLGQLEAQLDGAKAQLAKLKTEKYQHDVDEARAQLKGAATQCKIAAEAFSSAVNEIGWMRATAMDEARKAPSTKVVGEAFEGIKKQRDAIRTLKGACEVYIKQVDGVTPGVNKLRDHFAYISDWIQRVSQVEAQLAPDSPWGRATELAGRKNAVELGEWLNHMPFVRGECTRALQAALDKSAAAAIAPYEEAVRRVNAALAIAA